MKIADLNEGDYFKADGVEYMVTLKKKSGLIMASPTERFGTVTFERDTEVELSEEEGC